MKFREGKVNNALIGKPLVCPGSHARLGRPSACEGCRKQGAASASKGAGWVPPRRPASGPPTRAAVMRHGTAQIPWHVGPSVVSHPGRARGGQAGEQAGRLGRVSGAARGWQGRGARAGADAAPHAPQRCRGRRGRRSPGARGDAGAPGVAQQSQGAGTSAGRSRGRWRARRQTAHAQPSYEPYLWQPVGLLTTVKVSALWGHHDSV